MKNKLWIPMTLSLVAMLLAPTNSWAMAQDACSNNAVPRTTPSSVFAVLGNGSIVRHETTGLEWQRCAVGQTWDGSTCAGSATTRGWRGALELAEAAGDGWRLPNVNELRSIIEECRHDPAINRVVFPNAPSYIFWSASPSAIYRDWAWAVSFSRGHSLSGWVDKWNTFNIRLVRDAP